MHLIIYFILMVKLSTCVVYQIVPTWYWNALAYKGVVKIVSTCVKLCEHFFMPQCMYFCISYCELLHDDLG